MVKVSKLDPAETVQAEEREAATATAVAAAWRMAALSTCEPSPQVLGGSQAECSQHRNTERSIRCLHRGCTPALQRQRRYPRKTQAQYCCGIGVGVGADADVFLLLVVLDAVRARYRMQMTMTQRQSRCISGRAAAAC